MSGRSVYSDKVIDAAIVALSLSRPGVHVRLFTGTPAPVPDREHWQYAGRFGEYLVWETDDLLRHVSRRADEFYAALTGGTESEIITW